LTELAEILLEKEVIFSEDLERIFGKRKADLLKEEKEAINIAAAAQKNIAPVKTNKVKISVKGSTDKSESVLKVKKETPEKTTLKKAAKKEKDKGKK